MLTKLSRAANPILHTKFRPHTLSFSFCSKILTIDYLQQPSKSQIHNYGLYLSQSLNIMDIMGDKQNEVNLTIDSTLTDIGFVQFDTFGWESVVNNENEKIWKCGTYPAVLSYILSNEPSNIPTPTDITECRQFYRTEMELCGVEHIGLLKCETLKLNETIDGIELLTKYAFPLPDTYKSGYIYAIIIPFNNLNIMLKLQTTYKGQATGLRASVVLTKILEETKVNPVELIETMWSSDPYDATYKKGNTMNLSESEKYDISYPDDPLSVLRMKLIPKLLENIKLNEKDIAL